MLVNPFKPSVVFVGHNQIVQTQISRHRCGVSLISVSACHLFQFQHAPPSQHPISGHYRPTSETPFGWRFANEPIILAGFYVLTGLFSHQNCVLQLCCLFLVSEQTMATLSGATYIDGSFLYESFNVEFMNRKLLFIYVTQCLFIFKNRIITL